MKTYLRWLSVFLIAILLMGCGSNSRLPKLASSMKEKIESAYLLRMNEEILWYDESDESTWAEGVRYYGTFGNAVALYIPRLGGQYYEETGIDEGVYFYLNGELEFSDWIRREGLMPQEDIQKAAGFHKTFSTSMKRGDAFVCEGAQGIPEISPELQKEVEDAWWEANNFELPWTSERSDYKYFGNYDGTVVIYEKGTDMLGTLYDNTIDGVPIGYGTYFFWACREGEILRLGEAYERGWLERDDLWTIRDYTNWYTFNSKP